ncbi:hypothetical protein [Streptomyces zaomyceticus]|uniref:hypothetical protein n=1 Tax=Streptomyces zaomyceticus TaxID=68286 RepID=UPI0037949DFB
MIRSIHRGVGDHRAAAEAARAQRGTWTLAGLYSSSASAKSTARQIQAGDPSFPAYEPAGAFEAYAAPAGEDDAVWVRYVAGAEPVPELPDRMTVRVCHRGTGREYVGVCIVTVTVAALCPRCGGPRGVDTITPYRFPEDGEYYVADRWTNGCGHTDMYADVLRESRDRPLPLVPDGEPPLRPAAVEPPKPGSPAGIVLAFAEAHRGMHAAKAANILEDHGFVKEAEQVRTELRARGGRMSAKGAAHLLHTGGGC